MDVGAYIYVGWWAVVVGLMTRKDNSDKTGSLDWNI
jgi:hypothetical protein